MVKRRLSFQRHPSTAPGPPPRFVLQHEKLKQAIDWSRTQLNFYRVHMLFFLLTPCIVAGIFYASNGPNQIGYIDALFMASWVVSCLTVTGLQSVLLADLTTWQQVILFLMMTIGSTSSVSIITIVIRRRFFRRKFEYLVETNAAVRRRVNMIGAEEALAKGETFVPFAPRPDHPLGFSEPRPSLVQRFVATPPQSGAATPSPDAAKEKDKEKEKKKKKKQEKLRADMIKRVDVPVRVNAMSVGGWLSADDRKEEAEAARAGAREVVGSRVASGAEASPAEVDDEGDGIDHEARQTLAVPARELSQRLEEYQDKVGAPAPETKQTIQIDESAKPVRNPRLQLRRESSVESGDDQFATHARKPSERSNGPGSPTVDRFPRSRTIEFRDEQDGTSDLRLRRHRTYGQQDVGIRTDRPARRMSHSELRPMMRTLTRTATNNGPAPDLALHSGFGGFPNPITAVAGLVGRKLPIPNPLDRHLTMPRTQTFASVASGQVNDPNRKTAPYTSFDLVVGRNSRFHGLTTAQQEELGGVEFRALTVLLRVVVGYYLGSQLIAVLCLAPWLTYSGTYRPVFDAVPVNPTWFVFFQVWSAFSNNGMSLVDASMVPFQKAYWMIIVLSLLILGGNTAFPVFLRFVIWCVSKVVPTKSRVRETLQFLLDHPRRCFIYLFPSHQTWFLLFVLIVLNSIDWVSFCVLDIGNPDIEAIPVGTRIIDGLLQSFAVRSAGFAIVSLADVAPALQLLYVVMMYIAVYPIAISVRSTNVYEERSMGVFEEELEDMDDEEQSASASPTSYIAYHARKQLAFDMWWLVLALWLICIIERHNISADETPYITIFTLMFEVSSSYGTVGLSLGAPSGTSLSGGLRTLSKLVLCAVMVRGRHRGLPLAIDRAVMLPDLEGDDSRAFARTATGASGAGGGRAGSVLSREEGGGGVSDSVTLVRTEEPEEMEMSATASGSGSSAEEKRGTAEERVKPMAVAP